MDDHTNRIMDERTNLEAHKYQRVLFGHLCLQDNYNNGFPSIDRSINQ